MNFSDKLRESTICFFSGFHALNQQRKELLMIKQQSPQVEKSAVMRVLALALLIHLAAAGACRKAGLQVSQSSPIPPPTFPRPPKAPSLVECKCCYEEKQPKDMTECNGGHLFCIDCTKQFMEIQIGMQKTDLHCISQGECDKDFNKHEIERCLGEKGFMAYENLMQQKCIKQVRSNGGLDGFEECPHVSLCLLSYPSSVLLE